MVFYPALTFGWGDHVPRCSVWIDRVFPDFYALNFAAGGAIFGEDAHGKRKPWATPVAWWTKPGPRYSYGCGADESWDHFYITFRGARAKAMFEQGVIPPGKAWRCAVAKPEEMRLDFLRLLELIKAGQVNSLQAIHLLEGMFLSLHPQREKAESDPHSRNHRLYRLAEKIRLHPEQDWEMDRQAEKLGLSPVHFRRLFRAEFGVPGHQYLLRARLNMAARLLRVTNKPLKMIAEECGIPDVCYFARLFRQRIGTTPVRYRKQAGLVG
jgi:AraC-like DNA-binding protein